MKTKQEWLPRRAFVEAYARRWKLQSEPTHETCSRWARAWEKEGLARWVENASVGAGGYWEFSSKALEIAPTPSGRKASPSIKRDRKGKIKSYGNFKEMSIDENV